MTKGAFGLALLACAAPLAPARAAEPPLQPIKGWTLDYGETACTAIRTYGSAEAPITLAFRPSPNGNVVRAVVVRPGRASNAYHFELDAEIGTTRVKTTGLHFGSADHKSMVVWINFRREQLEGFRGSQVFTLHGGGEVQGSFALPGMATILDRLDECNEDLRKYWNAGKGAPPLSKPATPLRLSSPGRPRQFERPQRGDADGRRDRQAEGLPRPGDERRRHARCDDLLRPSRTRQVRSCAGCRGKAGQERADDGGEVENGRIGG
jgi:hypothetical protein